VIIQIGGSAHHAFSPVYDEGRTITVEGVVTEFRFINPHALMSMDVTDASGTVMKWTVEFGGRLNLSEVGWTEKSITPGERLRVIGNPTHTGSRRMFFRRIIRADGSELLNAAARRQDEIEEARRQRRERNQQK
jgi:hypothetical protein